MKPTTKKAPKPITSLRGLKTRLRALGTVDEETEKDIVCALIGHSRIQYTCMGYFNCARCGAQVGDPLAGYYDASHVVIVGHDCDVCRKNFETCTWKDTFMADEPFPS